MKKIQYIPTIILTILVIFACGEKGDDVQNETIDQNQESELVRKGTIDVESIDINSDGKIYECPMDWNVLDDKAGNCPTCGMNLKEYTLDEVKANLSKYGYRYKN